jgi:signal transduction histidine kinase
VDVETGHDGNHVFIAIKDTGPGVPPHERERIFDRFYRITGASAPGSGLGLAIAQRIASLHRATIRISDNTPHGSVFTVTF